MTDQEKWQLIQANFPESEWQNAWNVMMQESGGRVDAQNTDVPARERSYGLFQINTNPNAHGNWITAEQALDPAQNVAAAAKIWRGAGGRWDSDWVNAARNLGLGGAGSTSGPGGPGINGSSNTSAPYATASGIATGGRTPGEQMALDILRQNIRNYNNDRSSQLLQSQLMGGQYGY